MRGERWTRGWRPRRCRTWGIGALTVVVGLVGLACSAGDGGPALPPAIAEGELGAEANDGSAAPDEATLGRPAPSSTSSDDAPPPGVASREEVLITALEAQIARLNALDRAGYIARFIDDCGDPEAAGAFSYDFASPTVEVAGAVTADFKAITFLGGGDRAKVDYVADVLSDVWVVKDGEWWISTCPE